MTSCISHTRVQMDVELSEIGLNINQKQITIKRVANPAQLHLVTKSDIWAHIWPVSIELSQILDTLNLSAKIVDIGCGIGLTSIVSSKSAIVTGLDFDEMALQISRLNAKNNQVHPTFRQFNWNSDIPLDLCECFDLVIASDIIYMRQSIKPIIRCLKMMVPDGACILADPGRPNIQDFKDECTAGGYNVDIYQKKNIDTQVGFLKLANILLVYSNNSLKWVNAINVALAIHGYLILDGE